MPRKSDTTITNMKIELSMKKVKDDIYWTKRIWDSDKPIWLVIGNYPANTNLQQSDLTSMLIQNNTVSLGAGGVVIGNLFTRQVGHPSDRLLAEAFADDSIDELVKVAQDCSMVVIAVGSLIKKSKVATTRLEALLLRLQDEKHDYEIKQLISGERGQQMHPLALQREGWTLSGMDS